MNSSCKECPKYKIWQVDILGFLSSESNKSSGSEDKSHIDYYLILAVQIN